MNLFQVKAFFRYKLKAKYRKGHRVHPPFAFDLIRHYFFEKHPYYHFETINEIRAELLKNKKTIEVSDLGAGSKTFKSNKRKVGKLAKLNSTPQKQGELIYRIVSHFRPQNIIELGTSLGIGTLYLSLPNSMANVHTIEGCRNIADEASNTFKLAELDNINIHHGSFEQELPKVLSELPAVDMAYFDGNHSYKATISYFEQCLTKASESAVFIFDDISWSHEMTKAWEEISAHPQVSISFDLFRFGICILNKDVKKQHYIVAWP